MSQKIEVNCDRCGVEITDYDIKISSAKIHLWGVGVPRSYGGQRIDLCVRCYEGFVNFLENGEGNNENI